MKEGSNPKRATAYHEAGHAIMCRQVGMRLNKVTIVADKIAAGSCSYEKIIYGKFLEMEDLERMRLKLEKHALVALAGPIAQKVYNPRSFRNYHASEDYKRALEMAIRVNGSAKQAEAWLKWVEIRTRETLLTQWLIVEGLAEELLGKSTLNGEQVQQFVAELRRAKVRNRPFA